MIIFDDCSQHQFASVAHDIDHFHHCFRNYQETKKKVWPNETLRWTYLPPTVISINETSVLQLSTVAGNVCNKHEWDLCTSTFYRCRQWSYSWVLSSHRRRYYFIFFSSLVICLQDKDLQKAYHHIIKPENVIYIYVIYKLVQKINRYFVW